MSTVEQLEALQRRLRACTVCPNMQRPVVHGAAVSSKVMLVGQAPGVKEGPLGRPFAWTAGKTLFRWWHQAVGADEAAVRARVYIGAVARCFPGKLAKGGDRKPDKVEIEACSQWLAAEVSLLRPTLIVPLGSLAIAQVLGREVKLVEVVGHTLRSTFHGHQADVLCLPHPSGVSTWHTTEPGKTLLVKALGVLGRHPSVQEAFA